MKTTAVRLYGKEDLRLETFELPEITENEILAKITSDSICMSTFKVAEQGAAHKRVPNDVAEKPVIVGHEFCGKSTKPPYSLNRPVLTSTVPGGYNLTNTFFPHNS